MTGRRLAGPGGAAAVFVVNAAFLTAVSRHIRFGSSDNANALLAGVDMLRGNPFLRDWVLPTNSYWLLDLPIFGAAGLLFGVREILLHAVPAVVAMVTILVGARMARCGRPATRWWVGAGVLLVLLGLPHVYLVITFVQAPHHGVTVLACLVSFLLLSSARIGDLRWSAATGLLAVTVHSDAFALAAGVVPVAAAGVLEAVRTRRPGPLAAPLAAAAGAVAGAALLVAVVHLAGGYTLREDLPPHLDAWYENLRATPTVLGGLLGVLSRGGLSGGALAAHAVGAALFTLAVLLTVGRSVAGLVRGAPASGWLDDVLLLSSAGSIAFFALQTDPALQFGNARYLLPALVCGAVLTARRVAELTARVPGWAVAAPLLVLGAAYATTPIGIVRKPAPVNPAEGLVDWLEARNLERGYGRYWVAGLTTVTGREEVKVRPVLNDHGRLGPEPGFASLRWFDDQPFRFVVLEPAVPDPVDEPTAVATFGAPSASHDVGPYRVLVWDRNLALSSEKSP